MPAWVRTSPTFLKVPGRASSCGKCEFVVTLCSTFVYNTGPYNFKNVAYMQSILKQIIKMCFIHSSCKFCLAKNRSRALSILALCVAVSALLV